MTNALLQCAALVSFFAATACATSPQPGQGEPNDPSDAAVQGEAGRDTGNRDTGSNDLRLSPDAATPRDGVPPGEPECTIFVATTGSNGGMGHAADPFATLTKAASAAKAGDVVCVRQGSYAGFYSGKTIKGTATAPIIFRPYRGEKVVVDRALSGAGHVITLDQSATYLTIEDFEITDSGAPTSTDCASPTNAIKFYCIDQNPDTGVCAQQLGPITFQRLHIHHLSGRAIQGNGDGISILQNNIHHLNGWGLLVQGKGHRIKGNVVHHVGGLGIFTASPFIDGIVEANIVYNTNPWSCVSWPDAEGDAFYVWNSQHSLFKNNLIFGDFSNGMSFAGGTATKIYNNTITGGTKMGLAGNAGLSFKNNIVFGNAGGNISLNGATGEKNLTENPRFRDGVNVDPAKRDFRLSSESPALDKGVPVDEVREDIEGRKRPAGAGFDIGAYEMP